jgi:hypothetical protein
MAKKKTATLEINATIRTCANIRSRKHPDVQCTCPATQGDFCARHYKNPTRFRKGTPSSPIETGSKENSATKIQRWVRKMAGFLRFRRQGPGSCFPELAENQTDIYSLDAVSSIPGLYRWSYADTKNHIWLFDIRSLSMAYAQSETKVLLNPYTRDPIPAKKEESFQQRCNWLREKKYCIVHTTEAELSPEQLWHQRMLDVTMKYDALGYHTCLNWFEELSIFQLYGFYSELWELWFYRLNLPTAVKNQVVPNWNLAEAPLFRWSPLETRGRLEKRWWQKTMLDLLDRLVSSAQLKEHKILGALYGMTAFAIISTRVRTHYPWLVEMSDDEL